MQRELGVVERTFQMTNQRLEIGKRKKERLIDCEKAKEPRN